MLLIYSKCTVVEYALFCAHIMCHIIIICTETAKLVRQETPATAHPLSRMYIVATAHTQGRSPLHCLHTVLNKRFFTSTLSVHW